jgi:hypothetical protein
MNARGERARAAFLTAVVSSACNGQFDFDTTLDAGEPPIIIVEGGPNDASLIGDPISDMPRTAVHIVCGAADCLTSGCCSTSSGATCVDIGEGGICGGILIQCDDTDDCPEGQVCCAESEDLALPAFRGSAGDDDHLLRVHCEPEAHCRGDHFVMLCHPDRPLPCAQCVAASLAGLPPGYHQCAATQ